MKTQKVLITGGNGFIGSLLVDKLLKKDFEVASYDSNVNFISNDSYYKACLQLRKKLYLKPSVTYKGDIRDKEKLKKVINSYKPDVVVHLAGLAMARPLIQFASEMIPINMMGTFNVLEAFEKSTAEKIIYTSSSMAYGHFKQTPQTEEFILDPINAYGACKAAGEYFVKLSEKRWSIVRPTSVYGIGDCANRVSQLLIDAAFQKKSAWVVEGETLDFSYVQDVADGFVKVILKEESDFQTFNISAGISRSAVEFAEIVKKYFPDFNYEVKKAGKQQVYRGPQDIQKARALLGFKPKYDLERGIEETIQLLKQYNFYKTL